MISFVILVWVTMASTDTIQPLISGRRNNSGITVISLFCSATWRFPSTRWFCSSQPSAPQIVSTIARAMISNSCIESFNGKLRDELLNGEIFDTILEAKVITENWRNHYNKLRPHSSLGYRPPSPGAILITQFASAWVIFTKLCIGSTIWGRSH